MAPLSPAEANLVGLTHSMEACSAAEMSKGLQHQKLRKAAQEFEAILISSWWEQMRTSFPGSLEADEQPGTDTLTSLGLQAMSGALASKGGLGISQMLVRQLEPSLSRSDSGTPGTKD